jgi:hypothetical protein
LANRHFPADENSFADAADAHVIAADVIAAQARRTAFVRFAIIGLLLVTRDPR